MSRFTEYYARNKDRIRAKARAWRKANRAKINAYNRKAAARRRDAGLVSYETAYKRRNPDKARKFAKVIRERLPDWYVRGLIVQKTGMKKSDVPAVMVETCRALIQLKRRLKNGNEHTTEEHGSTPRRGTANPGRRAKRSAQVRAGA